MSTPTLPWWHDLDLDAAPDLTPAASSALAWRVGERAREADAPEPIIDADWLRQWSEPVPFDPSGHESAYEASEREGW